MPAFDSATTPFEEAGRAVARVFGAGAGWNAGRRRRAAEVIVTHTAPVVDVAADPEGHLCFTGQARRKPSSLAGRFVAGGFAGRVRANPLDGSAGARRRPGPGAAGAPSPGIRR